MAGYDNPTDAARAMNIPEPTYLGHENGSRGFKAKADRYARFFRVDLEWLLTGRGSPKGPTTEALSVPLISWVSAGNMRTPDDVEETDVARRLRVADLDPEGEWVALRVDGTSMDRISPPDSVIFVNLKDKRLVANACYVIADSETGEASYKRWRTSPARWEPVSTDLTHEPMYLDEMTGEPRVVGRVRRSYIDM